MDRPQHDTTTMKVDSRYSPAGNLHGERHLASCKSLAMRMFSLNAGDGDRPHTRDYEYVGHVLKGRARLDRGGQAMNLAPGDSYCIPAGSAHCFKIVEAPFECIEATCPPSYVHDRDKPV